MKRKLPLIGLLLLPLCWHCASDSAVPSPSGQSGAQLASVYCASCHLLPEPGLLDSATWTHELLPNMGCRLGIQTPGYDPLKTLSVTDQALVEALGVYPTKPRIATEDWQKIVDFYHNGAPPVLAQPARATPQPRLPNFFQVHKNRPGQLPPLVTLTQFSTTSRELFVGTAVGQLLAYDAQLHLKDSFALFMPPVCVAQQPGSDTLHTLSIGQLRPNEQNKGLFGIFSRAAAGKGFERIERLQRPVWFEEADLVPGGAREIVICQYGYQSGKLTWHQRVGNGWQEHVLSAAAGAIKTAIRDFDHNGLPDVMALLAQGDERIVVWYNRGNGQFEEQTVLRFPPVYGSTDLQVVDFNADGALDILYANGDNDDFSPIQKPYHGLRLFLNDGHNQFNQAWFFPWPGAFQVRAADFDGDGDLDLAATAFFGLDPTQPGDQFVYLEQTQSLQFKPYTLPEATKGRWLVMDAGDPDGDGDTDLLLGSYLGYERTGSPRLPLVDRQLAFLFLENKRLKTKKL